MGDSSVSCVLSGLTLYSEDAVFIPLQTAKDACKLEGARLYGSPNAVALFDPLTLPIYVKTDDYGFFDRIEESENTRIISEYFAMDIGQFLDGCSIGSPANVPKGSTRSIFLAGCYVAREVYDRFSRPISGGRYAGSLWSDTYPAESHLLSVGCVPWETLKRPGGSFRVFAHPELPDILFSFDGSRIGIFRASELEGRLSDFYEETSSERSYGRYESRPLQKLHGDLIRMGTKGFPAERIKIAQQSSALAAHLRQDCDKLKVRIKSTLESDGLLETASPDLAWTTRPVNQSYELTYLRNLTCFGGLYDLYFEQLWSRNDPESFEETAKFLQFIRSMNWLNRILMPTVTGSQVPEHDQSYIAAKFVADLALKRLRNSNLGDK